VIFEEKQNKYVKVENLKISFQSLSFQKIRKNDEIGKLKSNDECILLVDDEH
jgi:hypothetical protein